MHKQRKFSVSLFVLRKVVKHEFEGTFCWTFNYTLSQSANFNLQQELSKGDTAVAARLRKLA